MWLGTVEDYKNRITNNCYGRAYARRRIERYAKIELESAYSYGMINGNTGGVKMSTDKIAITIERSTLSKLDQLVKKRVYPSRSRAIQEAVQEKLNRMDRTRLARECAKLNIEEERALAEEGMSEELREWPEY